MKSGKALMLYGVCAYVISWLFFIPMALNHHQFLFVFPDDAAHARYQDIGHSFGALGPVLAAIITLKYYHNKTNWRQFLNGYSVRKLLVKGWVMAISPLIIFGFSVLISMVITQQSLDIAGFIQTNGLTKPFNLFAWFLPILFYGFGEEAGWRGYLLPALQAKHNAFKSTAILFVTWACWHFPTFFYRYDLQGAAYIGFVLGLFAGAIWLTFLFNYTRGSILAVSLWHLTFNAVSMIAKDDVFISALMSGVVVLFAVLILIKYKWANLSPFEKTTLQPDGQRPYFSGVTSKTKRVMLHKENKRSG